VTPACEATATQIEHKLASYYGILQHSRIDRARIYREIARLQQLRGNNLLACVYRLRAMRLMGADEFNDLLWVRPNLSDAGYPAEAEAAWAMYGQDVEHDAECRRLIESSRERCRSVDFERDYELYEDRRSGPAKVSVITSLYNAADKLPNFLRALQMQTLNRDGQIELVLVDSHSPADELAALRQTELTFPIPYLFVRTPERETIQTAWNRGIELSQAPYLSFLGVDETVRPDALDILAKHLDADERVDWVQANSLITQTDKNGALDLDVMLYDREGYTQNHVYLETCYLSWVGALYRRSIHDRCGYYDGTFGAAGDTEFKNRVLPYVKTKCIPQTLGLFLNYPEERTTQSPRAELEDFRAWYLHRTTAGVRYAFADRAASELEDMLRLALHYRKSYCRHWSTDFEYAGAVAQVLQERSPASAFLQLAEGIYQVLLAYRSLDFLTATGRRAFAKGHDQTRQLAARVAGCHAATGCLQEPVYSIFNDNRYEQHADVW